MTKRTPYIAFLLVLLASCVGDEPVRERVAVGDPCPEFSVSVNYEDSTIPLSLTFPTGQTSVLVFFNTICPDCREELPEIQLVYDEIQRRNLPVSLVAISRSQPAEEVAAYWQANSLTIPYSAQTDARVFSLFASSVIPRVYTISPAGIVTALWTDSPIASADDILSQIEI